MDIDFATGRVYHRGEATPDGRYYMTVWDPEEFRLRDIEIEPEAGFKYTHSYAVTCGPVGSHKLYGNADGKVCEMDLNVGVDGKLHVRPVCTESLDSEVTHGWPYTFATGPGGRIYWACNYGDHGPLPISLFAWDPKTETKTYLGTCALGGEWLHGGADAQTLAGGVLSTVTVPVASAPPPAFEATTRSWCEPSATRVVFQRPIADQRVGVTSVDSTQVPSMYTSRRVTTLLACTSTVATARSGAPGSGAARVIWGGTLAISARVRLRSDGSRL